MHESFHSFVSTSINVLTLIAGFLLLAGFLISTVKWAQQALAGDRTEAYEIYRQKMGRTVLIGLELLLAATILKTIVAPHTIEAFGLILLTVAIRTSLGWATSLEIYGRWPWQKH